MIDKFQDYLKSLSSNEEKDIETYLMFGLISTFLFLAIIGIATGRSLAFLF